MKRFPLLYLSTLFSAVVSVASFYIVEYYLFDRVEIVGEHVGLVRSFNPGIAFGIELPDGFQDILILSALVAVMFYAYLTAKTALSRIGFGFIIGGGFSNVFDRFLDGFVTDMIQVGTFPIFNIADSFITVGVGLLLLEMAIDWKKAAQMTS